jgi:hypothetical protein
VAAPLRLLPAHGGGWPGRHWNTVLDRAAPSGRPLGHWRFRLQRHEKHPGTSNGYGVPRGVVAHTRPRHTGPTGSGDQLAAASLGQDAAAEPGPDEVQLGFGHLSFHAEQEPIVEAAGVIEAVLVLISVPVIPHNSRSWCQPAELRVSREHSSPNKIPARPRDTSATSCWNPPRSAALTPD